MDTAQAIYVGVDVAKSPLDVAVLPTGEVRDFSNDTQGTLELRDWLAPQPVGLVVLEATGG
jgi:transposase